MASRVVLTSSLDNKTDEQDGKTVTMAADEARQFNEQIVKRQRKTIALSRRC